MYFNSRPHGGRRSSWKVRRGHREFQLTPSRRATSGQQWICKSKHISTHALTEGDYPNDPATGAAYLFQLTPSRRATAVSLHDFIVEEISTHALTEGDFSRVFFKAVQIFQLTPSRRATSVVCCYQFSALISTHALTEGDFCASSFLQAALLISTHALTEGDDHVRQNCFSVFVISTHALTEGDGYPVSVWDAWSHFNSRPHGGRQKPFIVSTMYFAFQLTPSRRATRYQCSADYPVYFNSRPHGGRRLLRHPVRRIHNISTHALTEGDAIRIG